MNWSPTAIAVLLATGFTTAPAQTKPQEPVKPHVLIETVGPDGWRARLGVTNVATMLSSEEGRAVWQPKLDPLLGGWQMMVGDEEAFAAASKRIFDYSGTIRIAVLVEPQGPANIAVSLEKDGRTDLGLLAQDIRDLIGKAIPGEWQDVAVAGKKVTVRKEHSDTITAPIVTADRMMLFAGAESNLTTGLRLLDHFATRPVTLAAPKPGSPALQVTFDIAGLLEVMDTTERSVASSKALGFYQMDKATMSLRAAGPHVELDWDVALKGEAHGIVKAFFPDSQGVSGLSQLLPRKAAVWKVGRFDFGSFFDGIVNAIQAEDFFNNGDVRKEINDELGVDVWKDLLPHMTDEMLVVGSPFADFDRASEATWLLAWRLKDDKAFGKAFTTIMKNAKPLFSGSETVDVDGVELRRYGNMLGYDVWGAVGNGVFVLSGGRDAEEEATAVLRKAKVADFTIRADQETWFQQLKRRFPPGHNGLAQIDLMSVLSIPSMWWTDLLVFGPIPLDGPIDPDEADEKNEQFQELLKANKLTVVRSATGFKDRHWHWRLFW